MSYVSPYKKSILVGCELPFITWNLLFLGEILFLTGGKKFHTVFLIGQLKKFRKK